MAITSILNSTAGAVRERSHERRASLFVELMQPSPGSTVLDLGGGDGSFAARISRRCSVAVTVADIAASRRTARERYGFDVAVVEPEGPLPFDDAAFDIVLCNSVIEHVTLPGRECLELRLSEREWTRRAYQRQRAFAAEIQRVGRGYFVQTPHRAFPIDAHTWLPFTNFLPHETMRRLIPLLDRTWVKKCGVADWHLLDLAGMRELFPGADMWVERWLGLPKSIIAYARAGSG
jgi:SAM-dependent methyltransferase